MQSTYTISITRIADKEDNCLGCYYANMVFRPDEQGSCDLSSD
jgi:hypothetical protein